MTKRGVKCSRRVSTNQLRHYDRTLPVSVGAWSDVDLDSLAEGIQEPKQAVDVIARHANWIRGHRDFSPLVDKSRRPFFFTARPDLRGPIGLERL
jgi:hypothetical protein